eukprot:705607-Prymnesium_polylepis.1
MHPHLAQHLHLSPHALVVRLVTSSSSRGVRLLENAAHDAAPPSWAAPQATANAAAAGPKSSPPDSARRLRAPHELVPDAVRV